MMEPFPQRIRVFELVLPDGPHEVTDRIEIVTWPQTPVSELYAAIPAAVMSPPARENRIWKLKNSPGTRSSVSKIPGSRYSVSDLKNHTRLRVIPSRKEPILPDTVDQAEIRNGDIFVVEFKAADAWLVDDLDARDTHLTPELFSHAENQIIPRPTLPDPEQKHTQTSDNARSLVLNKQKPENKGRPPGLRGLGNM